MDTRTLSGLNLYALSRSRDLSALSEDQLRALIFNALPLYVESYAEQAYYEDLGRLAEAELARRRRSNPRRFL